MPTGSVMQEDMATGGLSSQVLINAGKKSLSRITDTQPAKTPAEDGAQIKEQHASDSALEAKGDGEGPLAE